MRISTMQGPLMTYILLQSMTSFICKQQRFLNIPWEPKKKYLQGQAISTALFTTLCAYCSEGKLRL